MIKLLRGCLQGVTDKVHTERGSWKPRGQSSRKSERKKPKETEIIHEEEPIIEKDLLMKEHSLKVQNLR